MKKFTVTMSAKMDLGATVVLWAKNEEDANDKAHNRSYRGKIKWQDEGINGDSVSAYSVAIKKEAVCQKKKTRGSI